MEKSRDAKLKMFFQANFNIISVFAYTQRNRIEENEFIVRGEILFMNTKTWRWLFWKGNKIYFCCENVGILYDDEVRDFISERASGWMFR